MEGQPETPRSLDQAATSCASTSAQSIPNGRTLVGSRPTWRRPAGAGPRLEVRRRRPQDEPGHRRKTVLAAANHSLTRQFVSRLRQQSPLALALRTAAACLVGDEGCVQVQCPEQELAGSVAEGGTEWSRFIPRTSRMNARRACTLHPSLPLTRWKWLLVRHDACTCHSVSWHASLSVEKNTTPRTHVYLRLY